MSKLSNSISSVSYRFERQIEIEQRAFAEQRTKLTAEFAVEKSRIYNELRQKEQEFDQRKDKMLQDKKDMAELLNKEFLEKTKMIEKKSQVKKLYNIRT